jgi:hypothetical protein
MRVGILGAGPAGLFAAWLLQQRGVDVTVFEARPHAGGISRSFMIYVRLGAHRLFTQDDRCSVICSLVPMGCHIRRNRSTCQASGFDPVNVLELLYRYFPITAGRIGLATYCAGAMPAEALRTFDEYVEHRMGLLSTFFFDPTRKDVWPAWQPDPADWAHARSASRAHLISAPKHKKIQLFLPGARWLAPFVGCGSTHPSMPWKSESRFYAARPSTGQPPFDHPGQAVGAGLPTHLPGRALSSSHRPALHLDNHWFTYGWALRD